MFLFIKKTFIYFYYIFRDWYFIRIRKTYLIFIIEFFFILKVKIAKYTRHSVIRHGQCNHANEELMSSLLLHTQWHCLSNTLHCDSTLMIELIVKMECHEWYAYGFFFFFCLCLKMINQNGIRQTLNIQIIHHEYIKWKETKMILDKRICPFVHPLLLKKHSALLF